MAFLYEELDNFSEKISIDELYEKKRISDLNKLTLYQKMLNRVHHKIKTTAKICKTETHCWFVVPEFIIGVTKFDQGACIAYIMDALKENGFQVQYYHPNTLFICWEHWVPSYVREEIRKKMGIQLNEFGEEIKDEEDEQPPEMQVEQIKNSKKYTPIKSYRPSGKLVYSEDLLNKIEDKLNK